MDFTNYQEDKFYETKSTTPRDNRIISTKNRPKTSSVGKYLKTALINIDSEVRKKTLGILKQQIA